MQKKIIALAVAALASSAAFAQSNVTIYGVADASFENTRASGGTQTAAGTAGNPGVATVVTAAAKNRVGSNSSYIGFKGTEDLGNGLKAVFQFENELDITGTSAAGTNGNNRPTGLANRDTYVALAGNFGTALIGFVSTPHRSTAAAFDLMPGAAGVGSSLNIIGRINAGAALNPLAAGGTTANTFGTSNVGGTSTVANNIGVIGRSNAIAYASPTFGGISGVLAYVPNETKDNSEVAAAAVKRSPSAWNAKLGYDNGPLSLAYSYLQIKDFGALGSVAAAQLTALQYSGAEKHKSHLLGAKYSMGDTTVSFMYDRTTANVYGDGTLGATDLQIKRTSYYLAGKQQFGKNSLTLAYAQAGKNKVNDQGDGLDREGGSGAKMIAVRYGYDFSKRTQAYAQYASIRNGANANYDFGVSSNAVNGAGNGVLQAGADPRSFGIGLRHSF